MTPDEEKRCENVLHYAFNGLHHLPFGIVKTPYYWKTNVYVDLSTHDSDTLTALVFAAHDQAVRLELTQSGPRMVGIMLYPRKCRIGGIADCHPTLEQKLAKWRGLGYVSVDLPGEDD